jgi:Tol biopolymer transport system component
MRFAVLWTILVVLVGCKGSSRVSPTETLILPTGRVTLVAGVKVAALSPDGKQLLYSLAEKNGASSHIYIANPDGTQPRRVTNWASDDHDPAWSTDGKRIIFVRACRYRPYSMGGMVWDDMDLWTINTDGTNEIRLTNGNFYQAGSPHFSPDQRRVVFWAYREPPSNSPTGQPGTSNVGIGDIGENGRVDRIRWMPMTAGPGGDTYFSADNRDPSFAPDGSTIAFVSNRVGRESPYDYEIWLADDAFRNIVQLTRLHTVLSSPAFVPDGRYILFTGETDQEGKTALWRIKPDGSDQTRLR